MNKQKLLFFLIFIFALTACSGTSEPQTEQTTNQQALEARRAPVEVAMVESGSISAIFNYSGNLQAQADIQISPKVSGEIKEVLVEVGDEVKAGDPIAIIDDELLQLDLQTAEVALKKAELDLAKMEEGARDEEIAAARSAVRLAEAALNDVALVDDDERTAAVLNLAQAQADLRRAQAEYDKIAWAGQVGTTPQAVQLEQATAAYEASLAGYNLNTNPSDATLAPLEAQLVEAQLNLILAEEPFRPLDFETAQVQIEQAKLSIEKTQLQLDYATIKAPFDGFIASVDIEQGSLVSSQTRVARIISKEIEVEIDIEASRLGQLAIGLPASITVSAYPGVNFPAVLSNIPPAADGTTHTFPVTVIPQDELGLLRSGMFADVSVLAQQQDNTLLVPRAAVTLVNEEPSVFVVVVSDDSHKAERRPITTGLRDSDFIEVLSGLDEGDVVVTNGQTNLIDGSNVVIVE